MFGWIWHRYCALGKVLYFTYLPLFAMDDQMVSHFSWIYFLLFFHSLWSAFESFLIYAFSTVPLHRKIKRRYKEHKSLEKNVEGEEIRRG